MSTKDQQGTDVATIGSGISAAESASISMIEATPELLEQAYAAIQDGELPPEVGDPGVTQRLILQRIQAGTFEDSLNPGDKLPSLQQFVDTPVIFYGFHFNPSSFRDAKDNASPSAVYAIIEIADPETAEMTTVQFGGVNVLMQLVKAWEESKFPFLAELKGNKTGQGYTTYWLRRPGDETSKA